MQGGPQTQPQTSWIWRRLAVENNQVAKFGVFAVLQTRGLLQILLHLNWRRHYTAQSVHCWKILHLKKVEKTKSKQVEKSHCVQSVRRKNYQRNKEKCGQICNFSQSVTICDTKNWQCFEFPPRLDSMPPLCSFDIYQYQVADSTTGDWWVIFAFHSDQKKDGKTAQKRDTQRWFKRLREGAQRESDECRWY